MSRYELARLNIASMKEPLDSPAMGDVVADLDRINALAEQAPGFVRRLQTERGDATALRPLGENMLVDMSGWRDVQSLNDGVYRSAHGEVMPRRKEWFERLAPLRTLGPAPRAFTFKPAYPAPDAREPRTLGDECPA